MSRHQIELTVNGDRVEADVESRLLLLDFLRGDLGLVGAHAGCEHGVCGACTVVVDGRTVRSCISFAVQANGSEVTTVESLAQNGQLDPVQLAFWEQH